MYKKVLTLIIAVTFITVTLIPFTVMARHGGKMNGQTQQFRTQSSLQTGNQSSLQTRDQSRLRDGSCLNSSQQSTAQAQKKGNTYGPGDGSGNSGVGPQDGTGYGAPSSR